MIRVAAKDWPPLQWQVSPVAQTNSAPTDKVAFLIRSSCGHPCTLAETLLPANSASRGGGNDPSEEKCAASVADFLGPHEAEVAEGKRPPAELVLSADRAGSQEAENAVDTQEEAVPGDPVNLNAEAAESYGFRSAIGARELPPHFDPMARAEVGEEDDGDSEEDDSFEEGQSAAAQPAEDLRFYQARVASVISLDDARAADTVSHEDMASPLSVIDRMRLEVSKSQAAQCLMASIVRGYIARQNVKLIRERLCHMDFSVSTSPNTLSPTRTDGERRQDVACHAVSPAPQA